MTEETYSPGELRHALIDMLRSMPWQEIAIPALRKRLEGVQGRLMRAKTLDEVAALQGEGRLLQHLLDAPEDALWGFEGG